MKPKPILSLGLTPALQRTMIFDQFTLDEVNRAREVVVSAAGKAVNVGLALAALGEPVVVTGCNGGATGRALAADMRARGVAPRFTAIPAPTRVCTTILARDRGTVTELVEEAPAMTARAWRVFRDTNLRLIRGCRLLAISGTLPPSAPSDRFYTDFADAAARAGVPLVIDSHRAPLLAVLSQRPLVAKLNVHELEITFGVSCRTEQAILRAAARLVAAGAQWAFVTHGAKPAYLVGSSGERWRLTPPAVAAVTNPIGSGDCTTGGLISAWLRGGDMTAAARFGLACGSANVLSLRPADFEPRAARKLLRACTAERVR